MRLAFGDVSRDVQPGMQLDIRPLGAGSFVLALPGRRVTFHCVRDGETVYLFWNGRPYELRLEREGSKPTLRHPSGSLETPMPGKLIKISVGVGQQVKKGDEILVVEAMKMENQIRATKDGRVARIAARVGDMVGPGSVLAEIE